MDDKELAQYEKLVLRPLNKLIPALAVPTIASMMTSMIYNLVDAYFVGRIGTSASAAIGILVSLHTVFQAIGFMHGHGSGSIISLRLGTGDHRAATRFASMAFFSSIVMSSIVMIIALVFMDPIMRLLGSTETILPYARAYGIYIIISGPLLSASCVLNNIMRYEGKAFYAMIGLVSGGVLNMVLDPLCMFTMGMGIAGAGFATALSQLVSFCILLFMFLSGKTISRISLRSLTDKEGRRGYHYILRNGLPSLIRQVLNSLSSATLNNAARPFGDPAIAAMAIVGRVVMFVGSAMIGIGQGYQPVAAYNYGAGKYSRVRRGFFFTWRMGEIVLGAFALLCFIFPEPIIRLFRDDPAVIAVGVPAMRFQCAAVAIQPLGVVCNMMFQSIGNSRLASLTASLRSGIYYIPALLILPPLIGIRGIESAQLAADVLTAITVAPLMVWFMKRLPQKDETTKIDFEYRETKGSA